MVNTRHINKNGLSFDCPEYYDIGSYPSSDESYSSIVALSKNDRTSEIYVMKYRDYAFDNNAKRNTFLLKEYLKMKGYENITEHRSLPYCFNAYAYSGVGRIKTTILFLINYNSPSPSASLESIIFKLPFLHLISSKNFFSSIPSFTSI